MKREYRIYKKGGYTYVHYVGFPEGVKIKKDKNLYDYEWGWMTVTKDGQYYDFQDEDHSLLIKLLMEGSVFETDGRFGVIDKDGNEVLPPVFEQIEKLKDSVFGRLGNSYWELKEFGSSTLRGNYGDSGFFVENGKKGWRKDGFVVIPAYYDDIWHADNSNFYQVLQNGKWSYINETGEKVLTYVREMEDDYNEIPFPLETHSKKIVVLQEYVGHPDNSDSNVVYYDGVWQRFDRLSNKDICRLFINPNDEKPLIDKDLELFNNKFSYEFSAYKVCSCNGLTDCLRKLQLMGLHGNSWHYIVKVWKPMGENPTAEELRNLRYQIEEHHQLGMLHFCLAHDINLAKGETKLFVVTYYNERCWPATWEYDWWEKRNELTLPQIKRRLLELRETINKDVKEEYRDEVWQDQLWGGIYSIHYSKKRIWKETVKVLDYFKAMGSPIINGIRDEADEIYSTLHFRTQFSRAKCRFHLHKLKWLIENGADINAHYDNYTGFDYIVGNYKGILEDEFSPKDKEYIEKMKDKFTNLLLTHGAKTLLQVREEESENDDYRVELMRMK